MENKMNPINYDDKKLKQIQTIAYLALVIAIVALSLNIWSVYTTKYDIKDKQTFQQKIDTVFDHQDKDLNNIFNNKENSQ